MLEELFHLPIPWWQGTIRLAAALILGGMIGWEREASRRPAGLRTHMLVSVAAAGFIILGLDVLGDQASPADRIGVVTAVTMGGGFLGAGLIVQAGPQVKGATTAASVWSVAAIGAASGAGSIGLAALLTLMALITLVPVRLLGRQASGNGPAKDDG